MIINSVVIDWDEVPEYSYVRRIPAIAGMEQLDFHKPVTFFVGENGSGKSTLLEAIAVAYGFNPEGGTRNYSFSTRDTHSDLYEAIRLYRGPARSNWGYFLRAESFYNVATKEEEYGRELGGRPRFYHEKSHGESFLAVAQDSFRPGGLYLLDEPEAALSPQRQLTLLMEIDRCAKAGAQFLIVSHSPILLALPGAEILSFDDGPLHPVGYEDTESYQIISLFINNREAMLKRLLRDEEEAEEDEEI